jgi:predicted DNA-binding protein
MSNEEYHCQRCSSLLYETVYCGFEVYECPICAQLHDEFGHIADKNQLIQFFVEKENNLDELYPHRKMDENEEFVEEVVNEDQRERFESLIRLGKIDDVIKSYLHESNKVTKELIFEVLSSWVYNLELKERFTFIKNIEHTELKVSLLDYYYNACDKNESDFYIKFLDDDDDRVRSEVAETLASYETPQVLKALETALEKEHSYEVKHALEQAINDIKDTFIDKRWEEIVKSSDESITDLAIKLLDDEDSHMRMFAADKLGWDGYPETKVLKVLASALKKETNEYVIEEIKDAIELNKQTLENARDTS